ncbi:MAG: MATE family efflux transporter [Clostridia bacterium]|nr:MATE family efflux transporter [Clostridia bacterium]
MQKTLKENKMGTMPVGKLLFSMSIPMMLSMLVQAMYNVVDGVYIANYSKDALAALTYAFPMQNLLIGSATGLAVGLNAILSKSLGEKDSGRVNRSAANALFLAGTVYVFFLFVGLFLARPFIAMQTKTEAVIDAGTDYLRIICCCSAFLNVQILFERMMQSTGRTIYTLFTQGIGAVINIILDPFFIYEKGDTVFGMKLGFGFGLGAKGAAIATVIGMAVAAVLAVLFNTIKNKDVRVSFKGFRPDGETIKRTLSVGVPSIIMVGVGSVMTSGMNMILSYRFSDLAASVFGVYFKLQSFVFMPTFGLNNGSIPIIAYNWGAQKRERMLSCVRIATFSIVVYMLFGFAMMQLFPEAMLTLFDADAEMMTMGTAALRTISFAFIAAGLCVGFIGLFQALGKGVFAMLVSMCRQLVILLPCAFLFSLTGNVNAVWWAFPLAEIVSALMCVIFFFKVKREIIDKIPS